MRFHVLCFLISISCLKTIAQECERCNEALRKDIFKQTNNLYIYSRYFENITENEYNEFKRNINSSGSIPIPEIGAIVSGSISYDDFKLKIREFNRRIESELTIYRADEYIYVQTSPIAYEYWAKCMEDCNARPGLYAFKSYESEDNGMFKLRYVPAPEEPDEIYCQIEIISEGVRVNKKVIVKKNGNATMTWARTFRDNKSTSIIAINGSKRPGGPVSYSANLKSIYIKPAGIKVLSCDYTYVTVETKTEVGPAVQNCVERPQRREREPRGGRGGNIVGQPAEMDVSPRIRRDVRSYLSEFSSSYCDGRQWARSCDDKWVGYYSVISVTPTPGYYFARSLNPSTDGDLKLGGPMAGWNAGQRCPQNDVVLVNSSDLKQMRVWLHKDVNAHLEMTSQRDVVMKETAFTNVDVTGRISFAIPNAKLVKYNIQISLSDGHTITINPDNVNELAFLNYKDDLTIFTLKPRTGS